MSRTAKKLSFENSVVITNRIATDLPRVEAALRALAVKTNNPDAAKLAGMIGQVIASWSAVTGYVVSTRAVEYRESELHEIKRKQAAKRGSIVEAETESEDDFEL